MHTKQYEVAVIGGGILGTATAMVLARRLRDSLIVLEAEERIATHQSGHNSGVIHSGLYYKPGSLKARTMHPWSRSDVSLLRGERRSPRAVR